MVLNGAAPVPALVSHAAVAEAADEIPAQVRPVLVHNGCLDVFHVEAERIAEEQDEEQRNGKSQVEASEVPEQVVDLLDGDRLDISRIHAFFPSWFPFFINAMKASLRSASGFSGQVSRMISSGLPAATIRPSLIITIRPQWRASSM